VPDVILLPGIVAPAAVRYAPLLEHLDGVNAIPKDLEVYASQEAPSDYSIESELAGITATADRTGFERFHLYGHSGGGACALAYAAAEPKRLLSLAVDEPATDFSDEDHSDPYWDEIAAAQSLPGPDAIAAFLRLQLAPGVEPPPRPQGPPPPWMANRTAGIRAFTQALARPPRRAVPLRGVRRPGALHPRQPQPSTLDHHARPARRSLPQLLLRTLRRPAPPEYIPSSRTATHRRTPHHALGARRSRLTIQGKCSAPT